jgi:hypothetical protein
LAGAKTNLPQKGLPGATRKLWNHGTCTVW